MDALLFHICPFIFEPNLALDLEYPSMLIMEIFTFISPPFLSISFVRGINRNYHKFWRAYTIILKLNFVIRLGNYISQS